MVVAVELVIIKVPLYPDGVTPDMVNSPSGVMGNPETVSVAIPLDHVAPVTV